LLPDTAEGLQSVFEHSVRGWAGVRCSVPDRLPVVGPVDQAPAGLWINTAMGSRGLTLAVLCGELLAARWHHEPLPVEHQLAQALNAQRYQR
jgi:tRNA 5-methylaminomethyl-2-thiouridine biosynthesis bifunctional protein